MVDFESAVYHHESTTIHNLQLACISSLFEYPRPRAHHSTYIIAITPKQNITIQLTPTLALSPSSVKSAKPRSDILAVAAVRYGAVVVASLGLFPSADMIYAPRPTCSVSHAAIALRGKAEEPTCKPPGPQEITVAEMVSAAPLQERLWPLTMTSAGLAVKVSPATANTEAPCPDAEDAIALLTIDAVQSGAIVEAVPLSIIEASSALVTAPFATVVIQEVFISKC